MLKEEIFIVKKKNKNIAYYKNHTDTNNHVTILLVSNNAIFSYIELKKSGLTYEH